MTTVIHGQSRDISDAPRHDRRPPVILRLIPPLLVLAGLTAYAIRLQLTPFEIARWFVGMVALWAPGAALAYLWLRDEVPDRLPRATFAAIASYTLTTLLYFACALAAGQWRFYVAQLAVAAAAFAVWRNARPRLSQPDPYDRAARPGWTLALLIVLSLLLLSRYQVAERTDPATGDVRFVACLEQTYFAGQSYELARHTPPAQQACQAGVPERAYHLLPHLSAMLIARFGGLADVLHAHLVYHYAAVTVLLCLSLFSIAWRVAGTRAAGYLAASLLIILAIPLPPMVPSWLGHFCFNLFPIATSVLHPAVLTSPQMYTGMAPTFGVLLGAVYVCHGLRRGHSVGRLAIVCAAMVAATARFRVQVFLPLAPGFMLVLTWAWWRSRGRDRWLVAAAGLLAVSLAVLLVLETRRPGYLHDTATLQVGFYPNYRPFMDDWPGASSARAALQRWLPPARVEPAWSVVSIVAFTLLNAIGPASLLAALALVCRRRCWRDWGLYLGLTLWLVAASIAGAVTLRAGYDDYSVGGQMLFHTGWYALPLLAVAAGSLVAWVQRRTRLRPVAFAIAGVTVIAAAVIYQVVRPPTRQERRFADEALDIPRNDWLSIRYLHDHTPPDAVILSTAHLEPNAAVYPGLAGRAAYLAYVAGTADLLPPAGPKPTRSRLDTIDQLWAESDPGRFASLLATTGATHVVEFSSRPLKIRPRDCLREVWNSPPAASQDAPRVRIYEVVTPPPAAETAAAAKGSGSPP